MAESIMKSLFSLKPYEIALIVFFALLVLLPYSIPFVVGYFIDSALGMIVLFLLTMTLFYFCHPILGVLFLFVCYELLRRSSFVMPQVPMLTQSPSQDKKDEQMWRMNPKTEMTLEEEVVSEKAPMDGSKSGMSLVVESSSYKPVTSQVSGSTYI